MARLLCRCVAVLLCVALPGVATAQGLVRPAGRKGLPQEHEYQKQLRAYLATLTAQDYTLPTGELKVVTPTNPDDLLRTWALSVDVPRIGAKRCAPSLNLPPQQLLLSTLESPQGVLTPFVWPEPLVWIASWQNPGNPYANSKAARLRAFAFAVVDLMMLDEQQEFSKAPLYHRADWFGPHLLMYAYVHAGVKDVLPPEVLKAYETGLKKMVLRVIGWGPKAEETYFDMTNVTAMAILSRSMKDPELNKAMEAYARKFLTDGEFFRASGTFLDQGCYDPGFNGLTLYFATWAALASDWPWAKESVAKAWKLRGYLMLPEPDEAQRGPRGRTYLGPTHMTLRTGSHVANDQWPWPYRNIGGAYLSDDALCQVAWPTEKQLQEIAPARAVAGMKAENPRGATDFLKNEELKSYPWSWRLWTGSFQFPMTNFAYDYYPPGFAAHRAAMEKKNPELFKLPFERAAGFVERFGDDFLIAKGSGASGYGIVVHTGPVSQYPGKNLFHFPNAPYGLSGGSLSAFWTPATGSVILGRRGGMFLPGGKPNNFDKPEAWRDWPVHAVFGSTGGNTFFTSARIQKPETTYELKDGKATVKVAGVIPPAPLEADAGLTGKVTYGRTFNYAPEGLTIETTVAGDGKDRVAELYEAIPVFHRERGFQSEESLRTKIELQTGSMFTEAKPTWTTGVTAIRLTRFGGTVTIQLDRPRRVKLSPKETEPGFLTGHLCRNVLIDLLDANDQPTPLKDARTVRYTIK